MYIVTSESDFSATSAASRVKDFFSLWASLGFPKYNGKTGLLVHRTKIIGPIRSRLGP